MDGMVNAMRLNSRFPKATLRINGRLETTMHEPIVKHGIDEAVCGNAEADSDEIRGAARSEGDAGDGR